MLRRCRCARALAACLLAGRERLFAADLIEPCFAQARLPDAERPLASEIIFGSLRQQAALHTLAARHCTLPAGRLSPVVTALLHVGIYQLIWLDRVPAYAAISSTVDAARQLGQLRSASLINAILRSVQRSILTLRRPYTQQHLLDGSHLIIDAGQLCHVEHPLADPTNPAMLLERLCGVPAWLVGQWIRTAGIEQTCRTALHAVGRPSLSLRPTDTLPEDLAERMADFAVGLPEPHVHPAGRTLLLPPGTPLPAPLLDGTIAQPQDATAAGVVPRMACEPGEWIVDLCAGAGTKTLQLAREVGPDGRIIACDSSPARLARLEQQIAARGIGNVAVCSPAQLPALLQDRLVDQVLVDAPCSNAGVLSRRPEARERLTHAHIRSLGRTQAALLAQAAAMVRPGGQIAYSTCSLCHDENEKVVQHAAATLPLVIVAQWLTWPEPAADAWQDGGYLAILRKPDHDPA